MINHGGYNEMIKASITLTLNRVCTHENPQPNLALN